MTDPVPFIGSGGPRVTRPHEGNALALRSLGVRPFGWPTGAQSSH